MIKCNVNCIETLGLQDGPGIRTVIFLQGCPMRCKYCHNPEMWQTNVVNEYTSDELISIIERYVPYYASNGGITISGGEPLLQSEFLVELFKKCRDLNISTCLDTAGVGSNNYIELLKYTDIVIFDVKALSESDYSTLCSYDINESLKFINTCCELNKDIWIRQVIIPGINDTIEYIDSLSIFLNNITNIKNVEFLPYHSMAKDKYSKLGIKYVLDEISDMDRDKCNELLIELKKRLN